jgi:Predicted metal-dependent phosphoesterases (PHP family)
MKEYDLHMHTQSSGDSELEPEVLVKKAIDEDLDGVAITNHGEVADVQKVREFASPFDIEVISGAEVRSDDFGDILCLYIDEVPENDGSATDIMSSVREEGGITIIAHPFARRTVDFRGADGGVFLEADALEVVNARNMLDKLNKQAYSVAEELEMSMTGSSDTHFGFEVGRAKTVFPEDLTLREAIDRGETEAVGEGGNISSSMAMAYDKVRNLF